MSEAAFALADPEPLGKCTAEIKVSLPESILDKITTLASLAGKTKSAYLRDLAIEHCIGKFTVARMRNGEGPRSTD